MRNAILGGFFGVLLGVTFLAACGGGSTAPTALTQADLDAQVALLQQQLDTLTARLDGHEQTAPGLLGLNYCIATQGTYPSRNLTLPLVGGDAGAQLSASDPLLGSIGLFAGNFAPRGWAFCEGQLLDISQNQALYSILGTTYGGNGRTDFALPDLRGRAPVHPDGTIRLGTKVD